MKKITITSLFILSTILVFSCMSESGNSSSGPVRMPVNPNGDSELALLMRDMYDEGMKAREMILKGELPELATDFEKIHTADATEPEKAASPEYKVHAISYLQAVEALKNADRENVEASYTDMVNACMGCHQALCPGPVVRIKKMYLSER